MYYVYVLKSVRNQRRYVGSTGKKPEERVQEHNAGKAKYTRANRPYILEYVEPHEDKSVALKRELFFKTGKGRDALKQLIPR